MKLTDKRFWIFELLIATISIFLEIWILDGVDVEAVAIFLIAALLSGLIGFSVGTKSVLKLFLATWLSYTFIIIALALCLSIGEDTSNQDYLLLFGIILLITSFVPYLVISWLFHRIFIRRMSINKEE